MIETHLRSSVQPLFNMLGRVMVSLKLTPNTLTVFGLATGVLSGILISQGMMVEASVMLLVSGLLDVLDGTVARLTNKARKVGAYMDLTCDRVVESAIILGFAVAYPQHAFAYLIFLAAVLFNFSTLLAAGSLFKNTSVKSMHYDTSIIERTETFVVFGIMMLMPQYIFEVLMSLNALIVVCGVSRFLRVITVAKQGKKTRKKVTP